jgi:hypothetical protein
MRTALMKRRASLFAVVVSGVFGVAGWYLWCDWVPDSVMARLSGATKTEVREWLGPPDQTSKGDRYERWHYRRPFRLAEFRVDFDPVGTVDGWSYDR